MVETSISKTCRGWGCSNTELIDAHIIPAGFARLVRGPDHVIKITMNNSGRARQQLGEFDSGILCARCDNKLSEYDRYAIATLPKFSHNHTKAGPCVEMRDVVGDSLAKFALAVAWRASVSSRPAFSHVRLGRYEERACEALFDARPLEAFPDFRVFLNRYWSRHIGVEGMYLNISRSRLDQCNAYAFSLAGFRITTVFDPRPLPTFIRSQVINGSSVLRAFPIELETTSEFRQMQKMMEAEQAREACRR